MGTSESAGQAGEVATARPGQAGPGNGAAKPIDPLASALLAAAPDPVIALDEALRLDGLNPAAERLFGVSEAEHLGQDAFDALSVPDRYRPMIREAVASYLATGESEVLGTSLRLRGRLADGSEPVVLFTLVPLVLPGRTGFAAFVHAVAGQGATDLDGSESDVRFGMLSELAPVGIVQTDAAGRASFVNGRWCRLTGQSAEEALGRSWLEQVHPGDAVAVRENLAAALAGNAELRADFRLRSDSGSGAGDGAGEFTWVHATVRPMLGPDGEPTGQLAAFTNVHDRKQAEAERELARRRLTEQNTRLRELDLIKTEFLSTVSHELRSPLTSIVSFTDLLREDAAQFPPTAADYLDIIKRNADRLLRLISDLLYLSHVDEGGVSLELAPVAVPDVARESVRSFEAPAAEKNLQLSLSAGDGPVIEGDRTRLRQILDNLLSNAIKFTEPGGQVDVRSACDDGEWQVTVSDSGIGVPAGEAGHLFDRFFRASNAVGRNVPGTGLGLATAKAIAELHGGRIEAASDQGAGTTVIVHLPVSA